MAGLLVILIGIAVMAPIASRRERAGSSQLLWLMGAAVMIAALIL